MLEQPDTVSPCPLMHGCPDAIYLVNDKLRAPLSLIGMHFEVLPAAIQLSRIDRAYRSSWRSPVPMLDPAHPQPGFAQAIIPVANLCGHSPLL